ncbi:esterase-like activity of phytase family protein [Croceibacterium xixiisoli]|uniref:esterase-like activity of phytase family protein n=1 Tax=Croceibacterium xixiisoli TaxID=1476466 RepID=UPI00136B1371|nr:esterase-like activity of phytase family protein [Croceibacterium xixiisoli]
MPAQAEEETATATPAVRLEQRIPLDPTRFDAQFGGISGLAYDRWARRWLMISDDRSGHGPARFYRVRISQDRRQRLKIGKGKRVILTDRAGLPFPAPGTGREAVDPEAIRVMPDGTGLLWTSEGDVVDGFGPAVLRIDRQGREQGRIILPANLRLDPGQSSGIRDNATFEGLDITSDGALWIAMEGPLIEDGLPAAPGRTAPVRFSRLMDGAPARQYAYRLDAVPVRGQGAVADNGVSEILALDDRHMLVMERSGATDAAGRFQFHNRLYLADFGAAPDVAQMASLSAGTVAAAQKTLILDFDSLPGAPFGNLEGMDWLGGMQPDGSRRLLIVNDNGFEADRPTELLVVTIAAGLLP